jgi:hypothetical protein
MNATYGISLGVAGSAGGGGRLIKVGAFDAIVEYCVFGVWWWWLEVKVSWNGRSAARDVR